ncbi:MAG: class I SAM-dependent DNA methyltransferase [Actinomycetota bacterium]
MEGYSESTYGDRIAGEYDDFYGDLFDVEGTVAALAELAAGRPVLELAIGTGRIALPLTRAGASVSGIDVSEAMIEKLRAKPGGSDISVTMGDFADVSVEGTFGLVYVVFNTLFALRSQQDQVRCFANVAKVLDPGGLFVVEAFVPDIARYARHQHVGVDRIAVDSVGIDASRHDPVTQSISSQHVVLREGSISLYPVHIRYAWPSELDLMAQLGGLELKERWGGWDRAKFDSDSKFHVSLYVKN